MIETLFNIFLGIFVTCGIFVLFIIALLLVMVIAAIAVICINAMTGKCQGAMDIIEEFLDL